MSDATSQQNVNSVPAIKIKNLIARFERDSQIGKAEACECDV